MRILLLAILIPLVLSCNSRPELGVAPVPDNYEERLEEWKSYRVSVLSEPTGWLRLIDLIWLEEGENTFGASEAADIRFPEGAIADIAGTFILEEGVVTMRAEPGVYITHEGKPVTEMVIRDEDTRAELHHKSLIWFIDIRGDRYGVRLFNRDHPQVDAFDGFPFYETDPEWHLLARFEPWPEERTVTLQNVLGDTVHRVSPGRLVFEVNGVRYALEAYEASGDRLFVMFADETGRSETFQAGRYLLADPPGNGGLTVIDFNRAYNPPCAFSRFTTCHLPPPENRLPFAVTAGEKRPIGWDGLFSDSESTSQN